ncbi:MAG TPA: DNA-formamidopyrimidine glycosylase [Candidatus Paceibacterota bacterium]|nr:DNA-formamidopyrimidine glycosylase [Candidatus Paceibacterota bacterium]
MPELPEVETIVRGLRKKIVGRKIVGVWLGWPKLVKSHNPAEFARILKGKKITGVERRGKNILMDLSAPKGVELKLLTHQKMTGHFMVGKWRLAGDKWESLNGGHLGHKKNSYIRLMLTLDDGRGLGLSDVRKFAKIILGERKEIENLPELKKLGPEPLERGFTFSEFEKIAKNKKSAAKRALLDQNFIAGIGNIYSDEILWLSRIHPLQPISSLSKERLQKLFKAIKWVLQKAVRLRGSSVSDYRDSSGKPGSYAKTRFVYRKAGEPCPRCGAKIISMKVGARTGHFCGKCQKISA